MTDRQAYQETAEIEMQAFADQIERARERLGGHGGGAAAEEELLAAMERILERAQETLKRMEEAGDEEEWDAVRCQMEGILSEMRNAARNMGFTLPE